MISTKTWLVSLGGSILLALAPMASAQGPGAEPDLRKATGAPLTAPTAAPLRAQARSGPSSSTAQRPAADHMNPAETKEITFVAKAKAAKAMKVNGDKPSEQPAPTSNAESGGSPSGSGLAGKAKSLTVVVQAMKVKSQKVNGDKPSEQPAPTSSAKSDGAHGGSGLAGTAKTLTVVAQAMKVKSQKVNGDKPSEAPSSSSGRRTSGSSRGAFGFARFGDGRTAASFGRASAGERTGSRCSARGVCF